MNKIQTTMDLSPINQKAFARAAMSMTGLPFKKAFFVKVDQRAMSANELCNLTNKLTYVFQPIKPDKCEAYFIWLIKLGVLRREVDGQGLTNRIRLTPMGRSILSKWKHEIPRAGLLRKILEKGKRIITETQGS
jgi:hypothetical protein